MPSSKAAICHPERVHKAFGLCGPCYGKHKRTNSSEYINYHKEYSKHHRQKHPELYREAVRRWRKKTGKSLAHVKRFYNLEPSVYLQMVEQQKGLCYICHQKPKDSILAVDHDHETGRIRALLCRKCNAVLGMADDNVDILIRATQYLQDFSKGVR